MRLRFEAWTSPATGTHQKLFDFNPVSASGVRELSDYRDNSVAVTAASGLAEDLAGKWVKVFLGDTLWDEFEVVRTPRSTKRPGVIELSGPQRNGVVEWGAILPPNWPNHKEGVLDWSWAGDSPLPPLGLGDLASVKAVYHLTVDASAGTFTITVDGDTTEAIPYTANARRIEGTKVGTPQGLQGLDTVQDVTVTGTGDPGGSDPEDADPFVITFYNPPNPGVVTLDDSGLTGTATLELITGGVLDPAPITISKPADQQAGDPADYGNYGTPPLEVVTDIVNTGSDYAVKVNALTQFAGQQLVISVTPGETYSGLKIPIYSEGGGRHAIVVRTVFGDLIRRKEFNVTADTWTDLTVDDWVAPVGADKAIIRVANVEATNVSPFYVDWQGVTLFRGKAAATFTQIVRELLDAIQQRGTLTFLHAAFTDEEDTAGTALSTMSFLWRFGQTNLGHVLEDGRLRGYQWRVVECEHETGHTHDLEIYYAPDGELRDLTGPDGPVVRAASEFEKVERTPSRSVVFPHGKGELVEEVRDDSLVSLIGRRERVVDAETAADDQALADVGAAVFADDERNREALHARITGSAPHVPGRDFVEGDKVYWESSIQPKVAKPVSRIGWVHGNVAEFEVSGSRVLSPQGGLAEAVDRLLREPKRRRGDGGGGAVVALPAPPADAVTGAHIHLLAGSQEVDDEAVEWSGLFAAPLAFPTPSFPATEMVVQEPGYYPIYVHLAFDDWFGGGAVWVTRTRGGVTSQVWPPPGVTSLWTSPGGSSFTGLVPALEWESGDVIQVWFDGGEEVTLSEAVVVPWLADRRPKGSTASSTGIEIDVAAKGFHAFNGNNYDVPLPDYQAGDLLVAIVACSAATVTMSGWTELGTEVDSNVRGTVLWRVADGSEGSTATAVFSSDGSGMGVVVVRFRLDGMDWTTQPPSATLTAAGSTSPLTFPSASPTHGVGWYWVLLFSADTFSITPTATPDGYDQLARTSYPTASEKLWVGAAFQAVSGSISPGQISLGGSGRGVTGVVFVGGV